MNFVAATDLELFGILLKILPKTSPGLTAKVPVSGDEGAEMDVPMPMIDDCETRMRGERPQQDREERCPI